MFALRTAPASAPRRAPSNRLTGAIDALLRAHARRGDAEAAAIRIIVGGADAPALRQVWSRLPELALRGVSVFACLARAPRGRTGRDFIRRFAEAYGEDIGATRLSLAPPRAARGLYEQAIIGRTALWTGGPLRSARGCPVSQGELTWIASGDQGRQAASIARLLDASVWEVARPLASGGRAMRTRRPFLASAMAR